MGVVFQVPLSSVLTVSRLSPALLPPGPATHSLTLGVQGAQAVTDKRTTSKILAYAAGGTGGTDPFSSVFTAPFGSGAGGGSMVAALITATTTGGAAYQKAVVVAAAQVAILRRTTSKILAYAAGGGIGDPYSQVFSLLFGGGGAPGSSMVAALVEAKISGATNYPQSFGVASAQAASRIVRTGALRSAVNAEAAARLVVVGVIRSVTAARTTTATFYSVFRRSQAATSSQAASPTRLVSILRSTIDAQVIATARIAAHFAAVAAVSGQVSALARTTYFVRALLATDGQSVSRAVMLFVRHGAIDAQSAARTVLIAVARGAIGIQAVSYARMVAMSRLLTAFNGETAARTLLITAVRSATNAQAATLARIAAHVAALIAGNAQSVALSRMSGLIRGVGNAQSALISRSLATVRSATSAQITAAYRALSIKRSLTQGQVTARLLSVAIIRGAIDAQSAIANHAINSVRSAFEAQAVALAKAIAALRSASNAQSVGRSMLLTSQRAAASAQTAARTILVAIARKTVDTQSASGLFGPVRGKIVSAFSTNVAFLIEAYQHVGLPNYQNAPTASAEAVSLVKITTRTLVRSLASASNAALVRVFAAFRVLVASSLETAALGRLSAIGRGTINAQVAVYARTIAFLRLFTATSGQAGSAQRALGIARSAYDAQTTALKRGPGAARATVSAQSTSRGLLVGAIRGVVDAQTAVRSILVSITRSVAIAEVVSRTTGTIRSTAASAINSQVAALITVYNHVGLPFYKIVGALSGEVAGLLRATALFRAQNISTTQAASLSRTMARIMGVVSAQTGIIARRLAAVRTLGATSVELTIAAPTKNSGSVNFPKIASAVSGQAAAMIRFTALLRSYLVSTTQAVSLVPNALGYVFSKAVGAGEAQLAGFQRQVMALRNATTAQAVSLGRSIMAFRGAASPQTVSRFMTIPRRVATTSPQATAGVAIRALQHAYFAATTQLAGLTRSVAKLLSAVNAQTGVIFRATAALRSAISAQVAARPTTAVGRFLHGVSSSVAAATASHGRSIVMAAQSAQKTAANAAHISVHFFFMAFGVSSPNVAASGRARPVVMRVLTSTVSAMSILLHRFIPLALRRRVVRLPPPQLASTLPGCVRRVVLPPEVDEMSDYEICHPEPAFFSPFDPSDQDFFTFDWTLRGYPNDAIVFASVVSVPPGLNIVGPAFIDGPLVEVAVGAFNVPPLSMPVTYSLRCMAVFASGRISNFSIPFMVMAL